MENASKALLIAAGVLISIILTTFGIKVVTSSKGAVGKGEEIGGTISSTSKDATGKLSGLLGIQRETPHDVFIWKSNDPSSTDYGTIIGYTKKADSYTSLIFPERCTQINFEFDRDRYAEVGITVNEELFESRGFTNKIIKVEIPSTVKSIGEYAFGAPQTRSFNKLEEVVIGDGVINIGNYAFHSCTKLTSINIPDGVETIGNATFLYCESLENITIPSSVTNIGERVFLNCSNLKKVKIMSKSLSTVGRLAFSSIAPDAKIYVLNEEIKQALNGKYNGNTTVKVVTEEDMKNI